MRHGEALRSALHTWLRDKLPLARQIALGPLRKPAAGGSSTTYYLDVAIEEPGQARAEEWVLRIEPTARQIYPDASVERQYLVMKTLEAAAVPVPRVLWFEPDPAVFGAPFFVMERVEGRIADGRYHSHGLLADATAAERERIWHAAVAALAALHAADPRAFAFLDQPTSDRAIDHEFAPWSAYGRWSGVPLCQVQQKAWEWLEAHRPLQSSPGFSWGDARLPNMIFRGGRVAAVIDFETASLGGAELDLGWWLFFDWYVSAGMGVRRLDGVPDRESTLRLWEDLSGRRARDIEWHEVFAALRYSMISDRARRLAHQRREHVSQDRHPSVHRLVQLVGT